jgi:ankyrin repeat protein
VTNDDLIGALIQAADGEPELVQALLEAGADPTGMPLIMAIQCGEREIVEMMIGAGADVNAPFSHTTPLNRAISSSYPSIVELLLRAGAQVNQAAPDGLFPLAVARRQGRINATAAEREQIIALLIKAGAHEQHAGDA